MLKIGGHATPIIQADSRPFSLGGVRLPRTMTVRSVNAPRPFGDSEWCVTHHPLRRFGFVSLSQRPPAAWGLGVVRHAPPVAPDRPGFLGKSIGMTNPNLPKAPMFMGTGEFNGCRDGSFRKTDPAAFRLFNKSPILPSGWPCPSSSFREARSFERRDFDAIAPGRDVLRAGRNTPGSSSSAGAEGVRESSLWGEATAEAAGPGVRAGLSTTTCGRAWKSGS